MTNETSIEWTHREGNKGRTLNIVTGCDKYSAGCDNCYAATLAKRLKAMGSPRYQNGEDGFGVTLHWDLLGKPYTWNKPSTVFVCSMADLFHRAVPTHFLQTWFDIMNETPQHTYQLLTKRHGRLENIANQFKWGDNIWLGVSVESAVFKRRIDSLRKTPAKVKYLSVEPLLEDLGDLDLTGIDMVIVGGESGPGARPFDPAWARNILAQCREQNVNFFMKQLGANPIGVAISDRKGKHMNEWPSDLRVREFAG